MELSPDHLRRPVKMAKQALEKIAKEQELFGTYVFDQNQFEFQIMLSKLTLRILFHLILFIFKVIISQFFFVLFMIQNFKYINFFNNIQIAEQIIDRLLKMQKKLKQVLYSNGQSIRCSLWFFQSSLYEVIIIYPIAIFPYIKISTESPIQHFQVIEHLQTQQYFLVIVTKTGIWIAHELKIQENQLKIYQKSKSQLLNCEQRVVGVHLLTEDFLILFVKENGKLEYNFIQRNKVEKNINASKFKTLMTNKDYTLEIKNQKVRKSNLYVEYQGRDLLEIKNQNKVIQSIVNFNTKEIFVVTQDINSKVCSISKFFLEDYQIITGSDALLNLPCKPIQILLSQSIVLLNLGNRILLWSRNITTSIELPSTGICCGIKRADKLVFLVSIIQDINTLIYSMTITPTPKEEKNLASVKFSKFIELKYNDLILQYTPTQYPKSLPGLSLTSKLDIVHWLRDGSEKKIILNMQAQIRSAKLQKLKHSNYLQVIKKIGGAAEETIVTNNRIVTCVDEYQHNMLIKMSRVQAYLRRNGEAQIFLSSPIIGTLKLSINFTQQKQNSKKQIRQQRENIRISLGIKQPSMISNEESLCLNILNFQQLTPTKIINNKSKLTASQIFQGKVDMVLAGAFISNYVALAVEKQVHIFNLEAKPKRMHIICFDSQIKNIIPVNNVNLWGAILWDGSFQVFRIQEKQSIKMLEVDSLGHNFNDNIFSFNSTINTAAHIISIIGNYMIIASNDPLHIYQPQKTSLKGIKLNEEALGSYFYPVVDLSDSKGAGQKNIILSNIEQRWMLLSIPTKMLVKNLQQIKIQVQQIIAFPDVQNVLIAIVKDSNVCVLSANKIVVCSLQTGSIIYNTIFPFSPTQSGSQNLPYLRNWLNSQRVQHNTYSIQTRADMKETHPHLIKLNASRVLVYNQKQIWYASIFKKQIKLISYFSMPNDSFLEFRNNLGVHELQNLQFIEIFAEKLPITSVAAISDNLIAVLYSKMIVLIEISSIGGIVIKQELPFSQCPGLISITEFVGLYEQTSYYLKDESQRLVLLKENKKQKKYFLELQNQLDDEIVCIHRLKGWSDRIKKISLFNNEQNEEYEEMILKRDGQMIGGNNQRQVYI